MLTTIEVEISKRFGDFTKSIKRRLVVKQGLKPSRLLSKGVVPLLDGQSSVKADFHCKEESFGSCHVCFQKDSFLQAVPKPKKSSCLNSPLHTLVFYTESNVVPDLL